MKRIVLVISLALAGIEVQADKRYRDFTSADGKIIRGRVLKYDAAKNIVTIERDNKRSAHVPVSVFSEADQAYILEWDIIEKFRSNSSLKISCEKRRTNLPKEKESKKPKPADIHFEVELYAKNKTLTRDVRMEYNIYYEMSSERKGSGKHEQKFFHGELSIPLLEPGKKCLITTEKVRIYKSMISSDPVKKKKGEAPLIVPERVHGVRARLFMKLPSGKEAVREFSYPESFPKNRYSWKT